MLTTLCRVQATQCSLHFNKQQINKSVAHIYVRFNQNPDEKSYTMVDQEVMHL